MGNKKRYTKLLFLVMVFFATILVAANVFADDCDANKNKYYGQHQKCLSESNGHGHIYSVYDYACRIAAESEDSAISRNNTCATWLASASDSKTTVIEVSQPTGFVEVGIWGMCTMCEDTTSNIKFENDGGSITDFNTRFNRTKWGNPNKEIAKIDIEKFIKGLTPIPKDGYYEYTRMVEIQRWHSDGQTSAPDYTLITLKVGNVPGPPEEDEGLCEKWTPPSYTASGELRGTTSIDTRVRNERLAAQRNADWEQTGTWAMPTDIIKWYTCYYPGVQRTAKTMVSQVNYKNGGVWKGYEELSKNTCKSSTINYKPLAEAVGAYWTNRFKLSGSTLQSGGDIFGDTRLDWRPSLIGDSTTVGVLNGRNTVRKDAGKSYDETSITDEPNFVEIKVSNPTETVSTTCEDGSSGCTCVNKYDNGPLREARVTYNVASSNAWVKIPYNYKNSTSVTLANNKPVYSGETIKIEDIGIKVDQRKNETRTYATYATKVPNNGGNIKAQLIAYVSDNSGGQTNGNEPSPTPNGDGCNAVGSGSKQCKQFGEAKIEGELNGDGELFGKNYNRYGSSSASKAINKLRNGNGVYNAFDASAGDYMCFVSGIYPSESNGDEDMDSSGNGDGKWQYSKPTCTVIAKRPSFQVWGGDMYSSGEIDTKPAEKRNIYVSYKKGDYVVDKFNQTASGKTYYGSWVEEGIMLGGNASNGNLASGAATGLNDDSSKAYSGSEGEFASDRSPLTLSNYSGEKYEVGSSGMYNNIIDKENGIKEYGKSLIGYWVGDDTKFTLNTSTTISIGDANSWHKVSGATVMDARYLRSNVENLTIMGGDVPKKSTILIDNNSRDVKISGDIKYSRTNYDSLIDIPKVVIFAKNVDIVCSVNEVDAIIIATGKVDTCSDADKKDESDKKRDNQLRIFGTVIAGSVNLGRSYGQAAWKGEGNNGQTKAAEIFDFDSSILLWSEFMASSAETNTYKKVYQNEIAPRY